MPAQAHAAAPRLLDLAVTNGSTPFLGDGRLLTTVSPNGDGFRDAAHVHVPADAPPRGSRSQVVQTDTVHADPEDPCDERRRTCSRPRTFTQGRRRTIVWTPPRALPPRTYVLELAVTGAGGRRVYGLGKPGARVHGPVVRVQGIDAGFLEPSYAPGQEAAVLVSTDAKTLTFQVFAYGGGAFPTIRDLRTSGQAMTSAARVDWSAHRNAPAAIRVVRPGDWPSGLYFLRVSASDGRVGYAPFIVKPRDARQPPRRGRARDADVAGLQLRGRERRRLGRLLVRERRDAIAST